MILLDYIFPIAGIVCFAGLLIAVFSGLINLHFHGCSNRALDVVMMVGVILFLLIVLIVQFSLPAGLIKSSPWMKLILYPTFMAVNYTAVNAVNFIFDFLPGGEQSIVEISVITGIVYIAIIGAGLLFRVFSKKQ